MKPPTIYQALLLLVAQAMLITSCAAPSPVPEPPTTAPTPTPAQQVLRVYNPAGMRADGVFVDELLKEIMLQQGVTRPSLAAAFPRTEVEEMLIDHDAQAEITELFYKRGWTDGLPIVPPTEERVRDMLKGTDLSPEFVVGTLFPLAGQATVEKIAVNAVMAGCQPAYMPILLAAVEAISGEDFDLRGIATTTNPDVPMLIISGPVTEELGINAGTNALGRGWQANASIGRAVHLIVQNIGGSWLGLTDMSSLGQPGDFAMCLAENQDASPWGPLHVDLGFPRNANVVTVLGAEGTHSIRGIGHDSEGFLELVAAHLAGLERPHRAVMLLIVAQDTAAMLARDGWTRESMTQFIFEHARVPFSTYQRRFIEPGNVQGVPTWVLETTDPNAMIPAPFIEDRKSTMLIPVWPDNGAVSREIRLPWNWAELVKDVTD